MLFIGGGSVGNKITCHRWWQPIIGIAIINLLTVGPYVDQVLFQSESYLSTVSVILGAVTSLFHLAHVFAMLLPESCIRMQFLSSAGVVRAESNVKQAAANKISNMVNNAVDLAATKEQDGVLETHFGQGLLAYEKLGKVFVPAGGFSWTWRRIYNRSLFKEEGIWLSARLISSNAAQFVVSIFVLIAGVQISRSVNENYDIEEAQRLAGSVVELLFNNTVAESITAGMVANFSVIMTSFLSGSGFSRSCETGSFSTINETDCDFYGTYSSCDPNADNDYVCTLLDYATNATSNLDGLTALGLLNASGFDAASLIETSRVYLENAAESSVNSLYPTQKYMVLFPAIMATIVAFLAAVSLAVTYIPSVTSTTLQLRSGVIPTLRSPRFHKHRFASDTVTILTGSLFWGE